MRVVNRFADRRIWQKKKKSDIGFSGHSRETKKMAGNHGHVVTFAVRFSRKRDAKTLCCLKVRVF